MQEKRKLSWSYSAASDFLQCPRKWYHERWLKDVKQVESVALVEGNRIHKALELAVYGTRALPAELEAVRPVLDVLKRCPGVQAEKAYTLTQGLCPTSYYAKDAWLRAKVDVEAHPREGYAYVLDWKTGKVKITDQLRLTAAIILHSDPTLHTVDTAFVWLKTGEVSKERIRREDSHAIWSEWLGVAQRMDDAVRTGTFPPSPSGLCKQYCSVGAARCTHCGSAP